MVASAGLVERIFVAFTRLFRFVNALSDVGRLRDESVLNLKLVTVGIEVLVKTDVTDLANLVANDLLDVNLRNVKRGLPRYDDEIVVDERLAGHLGERILRENRVEDCVRDLVGNLVGVTLGNRFRGEEKAVFLAHR